MLLEKNYIGAVALFTKLAQAGNTKAHIKLGDMYFAGQGTEKRDYVQALYWYKKAAEDGDKGAQKKVAIMYDMGIGVAVDKKEAKVWYDRAK